MKHEQSRFSCKAVELHSSCCASVVQLIVTWALQSSQRASGDSEDGTTASARRENGARPEPEAPTRTRPPPKEVAAGDLKRADEADPADGTALTRDPSGPPVQVDRRPRFVRPILKCALPQALFTCL